MFYWINDHPFLYGCAVTLLASALLFSGVLPLETSAGVRAGGLIVFGAAVSLLLYRSHDRGDVVWFFLGGVITLVVAFVVSLKT